MTRLPAHVELVMVGSGPDLDALRALAAREGVADRVRFVGRIPNTQLPAVLATCHVGLISYPSEGLNNLYCAPNKLYEYAQAGLPVVARENPVLRAACERYGVGVVDDDVAAAVATLAGRMEDVRSRLPAFLDDHRWEIQAERLVDAYASLEARR